MDITEAVRQNLSAINEDYDALKPFMQKWVMKVEEAIQERAKTQADAAEALRSADYSVKAISETVGASRTTMYNHEQLLKRYIEQSTAKAMAQSPLSDVARLQDEKAILQEQIRKLMARDVDVELVKMQNRSLSTTLEGKNAEIKRLEARIKELSEENRALKMSGRRPPASIKSIPFKKK